MLDEIAKARHSRGRRPRLSFWRDAAKREIDILVERGVQVAWAIEAKVSSTGAPKFFKYLDTVGEELGVPVNRRVVVYGGDGSFETSHGIVCAFKDLGGLGI